MDSQGWHRLKWAIFSNQCWCFLMDNHAFSTSFRIPALLIYYPVFLIASAFIIKFRLLAQKLAMREVNSGHVYFACLSGMVGHNWITLVIEAFSRGLVDRIRRNQQKLASREPWKRCHDIKGQQTLVDNSRKGLKINDHWLDCKAIKA